MARIAATLFLVSFIVACGPNNSNNDGGHNGNDPCNTFGPNSPNKLGTIVCSCNAGATGCGDFDSPATCAQIDAGGGCVGSFTYTTCPTANRVGSCWGVGSVERYYSPNDTVDSGTANCAILNTCFTVN